MPVDASGWLVLAAALLFVLARLQAAGWFSGADPSASLKSRADQAGKRIEPFEIRRAALLLRVGVMRRSLESARAEIARVKGIFDTQPESVRAYLASHGVLFSEYLPRVESGVLQADALRLELALLNPAGDPASLKRLSGRCHALLREVRVCRDNACYVIKALNEGLLYAWACAGGTTPGSHATRLERA
jgi:hypothetical protein